MEHTLALIRKAHEGDKNARDTLVEENIGLVWSIVRRFKNRGVEMEDLFQIGSIGLMKAVDKFNPEYEVQFSTYAVPMIAGEMKRFLRDDGMIKVSRTLKEAAAKACRVRETLEKQKGQEPTVEEIARETGMSREELVLAMEAVSDVESLSQTIYNGEGNPILLGDRLPDTQDQNEELLNRMLLEQLLKELPEEEREIIHLRYFENLTQAQIAKRLGTTQVQISRTEKKILKKLREASRK